jgi:hypothetical protein
MVSYMLDHDKALDKTSRKYFKCHSAEIVKVIQIFFDT